MPLVDRGTHRIWYDTRGKDGKPPLLLIMGMGFSSRAWGELPERLSADFRVVVFDNRGSGRSTAPLRPFRVKDMAADAASVLEAAGASKAFVFGISMGGMVALELALGRPDLVRALVLGATFGGWAKSRKPSIPAIGDVLVGGALSRLGWHSLLGRALVSKEKVKGDLPSLGSWIVSGERVRPRVLVQQMTAVTLHSATSRLAEVKVPTLVMTGDRDRLVPDANARQLVRAIPGARFVLIPGAGHCFPLEKLDDTLREVTRFFREDVPAREGRAAAAGGRR